MTENDKKKFRQVYQFLKASEILGNFNEIKFNELLEPNTIFIPYTRFTCETNDPDKRFKMWKKIMEKDAQILRDAQIPFLREIRKDWQGQAVSIILI